MKHLSLTGDNPHSLDGLWDNMFAKIKEKKLNFPTSIGGHDSSEWDLIWLQCFNFFFLQTSPIPFIISAIIKLTFSSMNMPLVCQILCIR